MNQVLDFIEMRIPANSEYVGVIRLTLSGIANRMGFSYDDIEDLKIAVSEVINNAVQYIYKKSEKGFIEIGFAIFEDRLKVLISDQSNRFDIMNESKQPELYKRNHPVEFLTGCGLGLYLIETLMDEVHIQHDDGVAVFMTKLLERVQVERNAKTVST